MTTGNVTNSGDCYKSVLTINMLLGLSTLDSHDRDSLSSMSNYFKTKGTLTDKQIAYINSLADKYSPASEEFKASFDNEKRQTFELVVKYYRYTGYFKEMIRNYDMNSNFIPSRRQYERMCLNPYAIKALENYKKEPKYSIGDMITVRKGALGKIDDEVIGIIAEVSTDRVFSRGMRRYKVMWISGEHYTDSLLERDIKIYREPKKAKNNVTSD